MNLFTPKEERQVSRVFEMMEDTETKICIAVNRQKGRHSWERMDARKTVRDALKSVRREVDRVLTMMDKSDEERLHK